MPLYPVVKRNFPDLKPVLGLQQLHMTLGARRYDYALYTTNFPGTDLPVYFVDCAALFERPALYTFDADEHRRFILFTRAAIECSPAVSDLPRKFFTATTGTRRCCRCFCARSMRPTLRWLAPSR